ncbi:23S rRNA (uracil(1939)-C(5))-methyltransferase RlmD [Marinomonas algicola]|uniref:23S rRNA (uracil(1939)-C(5))-methyltransferase RlmD n=1 Tax=Marinomonas algicola TaxID=2773454 RepID=UPI001749CF25|nr:23S rRNA (uracil(1939)-C(5))-methyltransferase RlmD [Marinomonas algicola]
MKHKQSRRQAPKKIAPGAITDYFVDGLTHEAKGVARVNGKVVFIDGALPNERVSAQVIKPGRRFDEAKLISILEPAIDRVVPTCSHYDKCGGCRFQHLSYPSQIESKKTWLNSQLRNIPPTYSLTALQGSEFGYRRRARLSLRVKGASIELGFREKSSSSIVDIKQCPVLTFSLESLIVPLNRFIKSSEEVVKIGHIELLEDDVGVSVIIRLTSKLDPMIKDRWHAFADDYNLSLYWQEPAESKAVLNVEELRRYTVASTVIEFHPQDFIQVNAEMNQKMVSQAVSWLDLSAQDVVLDLFCGTGNFSFALARKAKAVVGIELLPSMVENAQRNQHLNRLDNVSFIAADLTKAESAADIPKGITKVFLDPPRAGAFEFLPNIINLKPDKILYVSCNASTLARDAEFLVANGYQVEKVSLMEMFPQTAHVETMMLLQKSSKQKR